MRRYTTPLQPKLQNQKERMLLKRLLLVVKDTLRTEALKNIDSNPKRNDKA